MLTSIDVDCYTRQDPQRALELGKIPDEGSALEALHGFYLDPISPNLPTLPDNWQFRLIQVPAPERHQGFFSGPE